ncbi:TolC family protein [Brevundimonas sp.]|uniref:TolC family protein n=1 Tax=Brevundimonas sp. TaxID=1871086 RepID=UPI0035641947
MPPSYRRPQRFAVGCALAALAAVLASPAWADPAPSFAELLAQLDQTPATLEAGALSDAAEARVRQARVRPNPTIALESANAFGTGPFSGYSNAETTLSLSQSLELWGRRTARINLARAEASTVSLQRDLAIVDAAGRLALTYAEAEAAQRQAVLAEENLTLTVADARAALALVEEGREPLLRGIQGESEAAAARARRDEAIAEQEAAFARLTAVAMLPDPVTTIDSSLLNRIPAGAIPAPAEAPTVRVASAQRDAAERRIAIERIRSRPDVTASVGVRRYEVEDATALTFGISLPLPLFDRNRGNIEAAQADFRAAEARFLTARQNAQADRAAARARLSASASRVAASDAGVTAADEAYRLSRIGFEAGRISQLELRVSRTALVAARTSAVDARLARVRAEIELARQDGRAPFQGAQ